jgi:hypothetical protein
LQLEEVASREAELRPATEEELQALEMQQRNECGSGDDVVEIPIGKDVLVEEFKRVESVHEEKVSCVFLDISVTVCNYNKANSFFCLSLPVR